MEKFHGRITGENDPLATLFEPCFEMLGLAEFYSDAWPFAPVPACLSVNLQGVGGGKILEFECAIIVGFNINKNAARGRNGNGAIMLAILRP